MSENLVMLQLPWLLLFGRLRKVGFPKLGLPGSKVTWQDFWEKSGSLAKLSSVIGVWVEESIAPVLTKDTQLDSVDWEIS